MKKRFLDYSIDCDGKHDQYQTKKQPRTFRYQNLVATKAAALPLFVAKSIFPLCDRFKGRFKIQVFLFFMDFELGKHENRCCCRCRDCCCYGKRSGNCWRCCSSSRPEAHDNLSFDLFNC